jgi:hypothetical protein
LLSVDEREARQPPAISIQRDLHGDIEFVVPLDRSGPAARVVTVVPRKPVINASSTNDQDGTGGTGDIQLNVEIRTLMRSTPGLF